MSKSQETPPPGGGRHLLRALRHRNFRLFIGGQAVSLTGLWLQWTALSWLVFRLTESAAWVGLVTLAIQGPGLVLSPFAGVLADRHEKRRMLVVTQSSAMAPALALGLLTLSGQVLPWHILLCALVAGVARAFEIPTRQAFLPELVGLDDLANAIALNSAVFNGARLIGPAVAGLLIPWVGEGWCFLANALAYLAVVLALIAMRLAAHEPDVAGRTSVLAELRDGILYVVGEPTLLALLGCLLVTSIFGMPYGVLLPSFAERQLGGGPDTFGYLQAAVGSGALVGALLLAARRLVSGLERWVVGAGFGFGVLLVVFAQSRTLVMALPALVLLGFCFMVQLATTNTLLQTIAPEGLRGRVMAIHTTVFLGFFPIAGIAAGAVADRFGERLVLVAGGTLVAGGALFFGRYILRFGPGALEEVRRRQEA